MGRKRSVNLNLPDRMRARVKNGTTYYTYDLGGKPRKEKPLGTDYVLAVQEWSKIHEAQPTARMTVGWLIGKYRASPQFDEVSSGTQADYGYALDKLLVKFADAPLDEVRPSHVTLYMDLRAKESKHRALREKAVLSMLFTWAIARDYCTVNPVAAIKTKRLPGRKNVEITDDVAESVYSKGAQDLRDAMDLAYFTGQRPGDVLSMAETDIRDGVLAFTQSKTGKAMRIAVAGDLGTLVDRMLARKRQFAVRSLALLVDMDGKPMTKAKLRKRFEDARDAAGVNGAAFQFRDLRRKASSDLRDQSGIKTAQALLGHSTEAMTEHYSGAKARTVTALPKKRVGGG